jgi:hypothetical protein
MILLNVVYEYPKKNIQVLKNFTIVSALFLQNFPQISHYVIFLYG